MTRSPHPLAALIAVASLVASTAFLAGCTTSAPREGSDGDKTAHAEKTSQYVVKKGDNLYRIAQATGHDYRELAAWNGLANADALVAGQVLRLTPPDEKGRESPVDKTSAPNAAAATSASTSDAAAKKTKTPNQDANDPFANLGRLGTGPTAPATAPTDDANAKPMPAHAWARPCRGKVISPFAEGVSRGVDFDGVVGDPIYAAAAGKVTLVTNALRGYGNLAVIKHGTNYLSVYTHANKILVREGDLVAKGQKIGEIGSSDSDRPKLHFEIRQSGRPVDPAKFLPAS